ncbi:MAG: AAA family ATPase [Thermodesulfobacteriota bacterium]
MYEKFFYLKERPFHITPDPGFLYLSKKHREAMDLLTFGINDKKGFLLLTGEVGTGKTTLCRAILDRLPGTTESALVLNPLLSALGLLVTINGDFGLDVDRHSVKPHLDRLNEFLLEVTAKGGNAVIIVDEAQNLNAKTLEMVRLLSNLETHTEKLLQIVLVGQPELKEKLRMPELRQLNQRIIVRYHLEPLDMEETEGYIQNRIFTAGGRGTVKFSPQAFRLIFEGSGGVPRLINITCDRALTAAFVQSKRTIDERVVASAIDEMRTEGLLSPAEPQSRSSFLGRLFSSADRSQQKQRVRQ